MAVNEKERRLIIAEEKLQRAKKEMDIFLTKELANTSNPHNDAREDIRLQKQLEEAKKEYREAMADMRAFSDEEIDLMADEMCGIPQNEELTPEEEKILDNIANLF
ncbi:unknown [Bacteroides sp. CAG:875]|uniref:hypothetical protein n=1 Tax=Phocaeicola coprocola TaxID=310298 RepID=UPI00033D4C1C|nr:hypothetical protein [Phocaeicola coprocola]MBM6903851.1 hypothetical protein [Phocaeicola coprocola]CDD51536.1 unknown [Bacteroides sp. CAG:875]